MTKKAERETMLISRGPLLNFWVAAFWLPHPITDEPFCYQGVQWRFNAYKSLCVPGLGPKMQTRVHDKIAGQKTAKLSKALGRELKPFNSKLWDKHSYNVMLLANLAKFTQNERLAAVLLETGD